MTKIRTLEDAQKAINELFQFVDSMKSRNIDLTGRRIINAGASRDENDYVTREELGLIKSEVNILRETLGVR